MRRGKPVYMIKMKSGSHVAFDSSTGDLVEFNHEYIGGRDNHFIVLADDTRRQVLDWDDKAKKLWKRHHG